MFITNTATNTKGQVDAWVLYVNSGATEGVASATNTAHVQRVTNKSARAPMWVGYTVCVCAQNSCLSKLRTSALCAARKLRPTLSDAFWSIKKALFCADT
jgi:hypothetical protein